MRTKICFLLLILLAVFSLNCASTSAPSNWLPEKEQSDKQAFGGWMTLQHKNKTILRGELLAVQDSQFVMFSEQEIKKIAIDSVIYAKLGLYEETNYAAVWTSIGSFSTITHGFGLIISFPLWVLLGTTESVIYSNQKILEYPAESIQKFKIFSRFPGGIPKNIPMNSIKPKYNYSTLPYATLPQQQLKTEEIALNLNSKSFRTQFKFSAIQFDDNEYNAKNLSFRYNFKNYFEAGLGMEFQNHHYYDPVTNISLSDSKLNPFIEIQKSFNFGFVSPFISGKYGLNGNNPKEYSYSLGTDIILENYSLGLHIDITRSTVTYRNLPPDEVQINHTVMMTGLVFYF